MRLLFRVLACLLLPSLPATAEEPAAKSIERLNLRELKAGERVVVTYVSAGPGYLLRRIYSMDGGESVKFTAIEQESVYDGKRKQLASEYEPIGDTVMTREELNGVESYFTFLRMEYPGNCYAYDKLTIDHFRDGKLIGTENFHDKTCVATWFTRKDGQVVRNGDTFRDFPVDLLWSMVPILLVEQRLWEEVRAEEG